MKEYNTNFFILSLLNNALYIWREKQIAKIGIKSQYMDCVFGWKMLFNCCIKKRHEEDEITNTVTFIYICWEGLTTKLVEWSFDTLKIHANTTVLFYHFIIYIIYRQIGWK